MTDNYLIVFPGTGRNMSLEGIEREVIRDARLQARVNKTSALVINAFTNKIVAVIPQEVGA